MNLLYIYIYIHSAFHVAGAWPEDINKTLYRPSVVPEQGAEQVWGGLQSPSPRKTATGMAPDYTLVLAFPWQRIVKCKKFIGARRTAVQA